MKPKANKASAGNGAVASRFHSAALRRAVPEMRRSYYAMSNSQDQILARELGKVGSIGGPGGASGASFAARFLPTETFSASVRIEADAREVLQATFRILSSMGEITDECAEPSGPPRISAVVGSGFLKMNPALVHVQVVAAGEHTSDVTISAAAKEGLIKQRTAEKAVGRFREEMLTTYA